MKKESLIFRQGPSRGSKVFRGIASFLKTAPLRGFSIVELLVAMAILMLLMALLTGMIAQIGKISTRTREDLVGFQSVRLGMEAISRRLSQAVLNPYWDYYDESGKRISDYKTQEPFTYGRYAELHFVIASLEKLGIQEKLPSQGVFFQAPLGFTQDSNLSRVKGLLNVVGFFCGSYEVQAPLSFFSSEKRLGLLELVVPAERTNMYASVYQTENGQAPNYGWLLPWVNDRGNHSYISPIGENILSVFFIPHYPIGEDQSALSKESYLAPQMFYDSRQTGPGGKPATLKRKNGKSWSASWLHQLPPIIDVYTVGLDDASGRRVMADEPLLNQIYSGFSSNDPGKLEEELDQLQERAKKIGINLRWFKNTVIVFASKVEGD